MNYRLFQYPLPAPEELEDLNAFLASHKVASVSHHVATANGASMLLFVVQTLASSAPTAPSKAPKVDYKNELSEQDFALFSRLREERKKIAGIEGVPVYAIFTNAQLAAMARDGAKTSADIAKIPGVGEARVENYAQRLLAILNPGK
ncbi:MAG: hypothetical protein GY930_20745 [bacterium]|nr:hypothetical protein [bacterium]